MGTAYIISSILFNEIFHPLPRISLILLTIQYWYTSNSVPSFIVLLCHTSPISYGKTHQGSKANIKGVKPMYDGIYVNNNPMSLKYEKKIFELQKKLFILF